MKKALLMALLLSTLVLSPTAIVLAGKDFFEGDVTFSGVLDGTVLDVRIEESARALHLRANYEEPFDESLLLSIGDSNHIGDHNVLIIEVRINLKNSRASVLWVWEEGSTYYRLYCYGSGDGSSGEYTIAVDEAEIWKKTPKTHGKARYKLDWSQQYDPKEVIDISF
jgi:hypothetical protein